MLSKKQKSKIWGVSIARIQVTKRDKLLLKKAVQNLRCKLRKALQILRCTYCTNLSDSERLREAICDIASEALRGCNKSRQLSPATSMMTLMMIMI
jgi:hypothetical protein